MDIFRSIYDNEVKRTQNTGEKKVFFSVPIKIYEKQVIGVESLVQRVVTADCDRIWGAGIFRHLVPKAHHRARQNFTANHVIISVDNSLCAIWHVINIILFVLSDEGSFFFLNLLYITLSGNYIIWA